MEENNVFSPEYITLIQNSVNLSDFVYEAIQEAIITGKLAPGSKLKQLKLADQLNVSQQTVREALKRLVNSGLVVQTPNKGFAVTEIPIEEQEEIYDIRTSLELLAVEDAVRLITQEQLGRMRDLMEYIASAGENKDTERVREANREFHMIPILATQKKHLIRIMEQIWDMTWTYFPWKSENEQLVSSKKDYDEHSAFLTALESRDPEKVRKVLIWINTSTKKSLLVARKEMQDSGTS